MTGDTTYHVGHLNVALLVDDWGSPAVAGFEDGVDQVNAVAGRSPGFVRQVDADDGFEAQIEASDHPLTKYTRRFAATLSVWESADDLDHFVHKTLHGAFLKRRAEWFQQIDKPSYVVWPLPAGHVPTLEEAFQRLKMLGENGPSSEAFDLNWHRKQAGREEVAHA